MIAPILSVPVRERGVVSLAAGEIRPPRRIDLDLGMRDPQIREENAASENPPPPTMRSRRQLFAATDQSASPFLAQQIAQEVLTDDAMPVPDPHAHAVAAYELAGDEGIPYFGLAEPVNFLA